MSREREILRSLIGGNGLGRHIGLSPARVAEAREALRRMEDGLYGVCRECSEAISRARLQAKPEATRCMACQIRHERRMDREGVHDIVGGSPQRAGVERRAGRARDPP